VTVLFFAPPAPVARRVILYFTCFLDVAFCAKVTTWLTAPPEQFTAPVPDTSAGLDESKHEVAFTTEAEIVDWPPEALTLDGEAASPVITGFGVLATAGAADHTPHTPRAPTPNAAAIPLSFTMPKSPPACRAENRLRRRSRRTPPLFCSSIELPAPVKMN
jgi:hypothetical protein